MLISLIIPGARSADLLIKMRDVIFSTNRYPIEIVMVTPNMEIPDCKNVRDTMKGANHAAAIGFSHATGDFIGWLSDDLDPQQSTFDNMADFLVHENSLCIGEYDFLDGGSFLNGKQYARWSLMTRATTDKIGFLDENYGSFYGDVDYSLRCWKAGGIVKTCPNSRMGAHGHQDSLSSRNSMNHAEKDREYFLKNWPEMK